MAERRKRVTKRTAGATSRTTRGGTGRGRTDRHARSKSHATDKSARSSSRGVSRTKSIDKKPAKITFTDKDKRKMDQELKKKYDGQRKTVQQERKWFEQDKKAMENEQKKLLKDKSVNERLKGQIKTEREGWLNRQKKAKVAGASASYSKINKAIKVWVKREVETKEEQIRITKSQGEMKQETSDIEDEREKLKAEQEEFERKKTEFEAKRDELDAQIKAAEEEQSRLKELEESYQIRDKEKEDNDQKCKRLSELLLIRDQDVVQKGAKLDQERIQVDELKNSFHSTVAGKRANFIKLLSGLSSEMVKWNSSFVELFNGVAVEAVGETKQEEELAVSNLAAKTSMEEYPKVDADKEAKAAEEYEVMKEEDPKPESKKGTSNIKDSTGEEPAPDPEKEVRDLDDNKDQNPKSEPETESTELKEEEAAPKPEMECSKLTELKGNAEIAEDNQV